MSALYIHIPFCSQKCPYCDFYSFVGSELQIESYIDLLCQNINVLKEVNLPSAPFETLYFGGGTPSLLQPKQIEKILKKIEECFGIDINAEVTMEANPGTITLQRLEGYRLAGINRLSLGVQSLQNENLHKLGRIHDVDQIYIGIENARKAAFDNLSLDLMFALPGQVVRDVEIELSELLSFDPEHVSLYGLSFEEGTDFYRQLQSGQLSKSDEGLYADQYELLHDQLELSGYEHYEISNFARPGFRSRHNQVYWERKHCQAIGVGSHSFIDKGWGERWSVPASMEEYKASLGDAENPARLVETYNKQEAMGEYIYLGMRTRDGVNKQAFQEKFNCHVEDVFPEALERIEVFLEITENHYCLNLKGWLLYDHLISNFL